MTTGNHFAPLPYGTASLAARIPSPLQRETARDAVKGAMAVCDAGAAIVRESRKRIAELEAALTEIRDHIGCSLEKLRTLAPNKYSGDYGIGVEDGHRFCSSIARAALATEK